MPIKLIGRSMVQAINIRLSSSTIQKYFVDTFDKAGAKTLRMAANFKILTDRSEDRIHLRLYGDFDGSSAFELIHLLKKYRPHASKIHIHTQGLNQIHPFGLDIFNKSYGIMNECVNRIAFSGDKAPDFLKPLSYTSL